MTSPSWSLLELTRLIKINSNLKNDGILRIIGQRYSLLNFIFISNFSKHNLFVGPKQAKMQTLRKYYFGERGNLEEFPPKKFWKS